jgi:hypothetical protein
MEKKKIIRWSIVGFFLLLITVTALDFGFGYIGVFKTKTVGKAQKDAERKVFEQTQSYVEGKRQEALKLYKEYLLASDQDSKDALKLVVSHSFANFDENLLSDELQIFIYNCKYK